MKCLLFAGRIFMEDYLSIGSKSNIRVSWLGLLLHSAFYKKKVSIILVVFLFCFARASSISCQCSKKIVKSMELPVGVIPGKWSQISLALVKFYVLIWRIERRTDIILLITYSFLFSQKQFKTYTKQTFITFSMTFYYVSFSISLSQKFSILQKFPPPQYLTSTPFAWRLHSRGGRETRKMNFLLDTRA